MAQPHGIRESLWHEFLSRHHLGDQEQEAFVAYLTRIGALPVERVEDLEDDYLDFLATGG